MATAARSAPLPFFRLAGTSRSQIAPGSIPQKRKDPPPRSPAGHPPAKDDREPPRADDKSDGTTTEPATAPSASPTDEYGSGRITCEGCGDAVSIRDEATGAFTVKHWDAHRGAWCVSPSRRAGVRCLASPRPDALITDPAFVFVPCSQSATASQIVAEVAPEAPISAPATQAQSPDASQPQAKRRRAKRTEEERIDYLRSDPYVAKFEAYRVLCASCDKWIRLRPNSTYCSIPWDAHRKSCLAKRV